MSVVIPLVAADGTQSTVTLASPVVNTVTGGFFDDFIGAAGSKPDPTHWGVATRNWASTTPMTSANVYLDGASHCVIECTTAGVSGMFSGFSSIGRTPITTQFGYGRIEANIKVPQGFPGAWPAWWVVGTTFPNWPACGEMDIWEMFGLSTSYYATLHGTGGASGSANEAQIYIPASRVGVSDLSSGYHTYWMNYAANSLSVGIDAYIAASWTPSSLTPSGAQWDLNVNVVPIFDFNLYGPAPSTTQYLTIDWVRFTPA